MLPGELVRGYSIFGLPWGHKSAPQLFMGIGTIATRQRTDSSAPHRTRCGGCGGAPAQAPHRLHEGAPTWHLMRAAHRTRTLNSAFFLRCYPTAVDRHGADPGAEWRRCGVGELRRGSDPTEGLWARSEAAELLPGAILTLHPAQRRSPRDSNQSVFFMIRLFIYASRTTPVTCLVSPCGIPDIGR